jgi:hypothetical protein
VLIGAVTRRLVRDAVEVGAERLLELKGKAAPVPAYPLVTIFGDALVARHLDVSIVGREREQRALADAWQRALSQRACHLFTVLGAAGIGKSRLSAEFLEALDGPRVAQGRCLSYGDAGITYWPVVEIVSQLGQRPSDPRAAAALASLLGEAVAVALAEPTDMLGAKADAFVDLAEVLAAAGRREDAAEAVASAEALYAAKGHLVGVARAQSLLTALRAPVT